MSSSQLAAIEVHVRQQINAEEAASTDWLHLADTSNALVRLINEQGVEVSQIVYQFLDETLDRRDADYGAFRRRQMRMALEDGTAFPT